MNKLEFKEAMRVASENNLAQIIDGEFEDDEVFLASGLKISFGSYYATVEGIMPTEIMDDISEKYSHNSYGTGIDSEYRFDTKEDLLFLLVKLKNYSIERGESSLEEILSCDELISKVNYEILRKVNPTISAYDWMQGDKNKDLYLYSFTKSTDSEIGRKYREAVLEFDKAVNPFLSNSLSVYELKDYMNQVSIDFELYNPISEKDRENCCRMEIKDLNSKNSTVYYRNPDGFALKLKCKDNKSSLTVSHYFSSKGKYESDKGEIIAINYISNDKENNIDLRLNLTTGRIGATYEEHKQKATYEQMEFVYNKLLEAIEYAKSITNNNVKTIQQV